MSAKQGIYMRIAGETGDVNIEIVGVIGWEVWYQQMRDMLRAIPDGTKRVVFDIYSPGGDVWEGNGIIQEIGQLSKRVETVANVQVAASMAALIAAAAKTRTIASNGRWLVHNPWTAVQGDAGELEKRAKELRDAEMEAANFLAERTGKKPDEMLKLMAEERWLTPEEAKDFGFVHSISDPFDAGAYATVRAEIEAAGKWPKALVEIPKPVENKENADAANPADGAKVDQGAAVEQPANSDLQDALAASYAAGREAGLADGILAGKQQAESERADELKRLQEALKVAEAKASKEQSLKDIAQAKLDTQAKAHDQRIAALHAQLETATAQLRRLLDSAMQFEPEITTWEQALKKCGGDYARAAKQYPQLRDQYVAAQRQGKGK